MERQCYVCDLPVDKVCSTCDSQCCETHFETIHNPICKVGKAEKVSRIGILT